LQRRDLAEASARERHRQQQWVPARLLLSKVGQNPLQVVWFQPVPDRGFLRKRQDPTSSCNLAWPAWATRVPRAPEGFCAQDATPIERPRERAQALPAAPRSPAGDHHVFGGLRALRAQRIRAPGDQDQSAVARAKSALT
jgi:hypothetical protein